MKKRTFVFPKPSEKSISAAGARIQEALEQVPYSVHLNSRGERDSATLYVGNIDNSAREKDLSKALDKIFARIRVEKVTIPRVKFSEWSINVWLHRDIMGTQSPGEGI